MLIKTYMDKEQMQKQVTPKNRLTLIDKLNSASILLLISIIVGGAYILPKAINETREHAQASGILTKEVLTNLNIENKKALLEHLEYKVVIVTLSDDMRKSLHTNSNFGPNPVDPGEFNKTLIYLSENGSISYYHFNGSIAIEDYNKLPGNAVWKILEEMVSNIIL